MSATDAPALRVAFVGQSVYFRQCALEAPAGGLDPVFLDFRAAASPEPLLARLLEVDPDVVLVFRPEIIPPGLFDGLRALTIGYLTEPLPRVGGTEHPDLRARMWWLEQVDAGNFDRIVSFDPLIAQTAASVLPVWRSLPLPVADSFFMDVHERAHPPRLLFIGRSTEHREQLLAALKRRHRIVHIGHGLFGEQLRALFARSRRPAQPPQQPLPVVREPRVHRARRRASRWSPSRSAPSTACARAPTSWRCARHPSCSRSPTSSRASPAPTRLCRRPDARRPSASARPRCIRSSCEPRCGTPPSGQAGGAGPRAAARSYSRRAVRTASPQAAFSTGHERAANVFANALRAHPHLSDRESRLCELIEYFGWETGHRAQFATPWFYEDDPRARGYEKALGVDNMTFQILHMYGLFNRMDPERPDFYWLYDGIVERLEALGGPGELSVLDFGTGLGQIGLAMCTAGHRTVMSDRVPDFLKFVEFLARIRKLEPVVHHSETDHSFYDTGADGSPFGLVVEWSAFEHVADAIAALESITAGLVPGGMFVTTTFCKDWTPELLEHYRRDSQDDSIADQYLSGEPDRWLRERFDVVTVPQSIAKVLVRRA